MKGIAIRTLALLVIAVAAIGGISYLLFTQFGKVRGTVDYNYCVNRVLSACSVCEDKSNCVVAYDNKDVAEKCFSLVPYKKANSLSDNTFKVDCSKYQPG